MVRVGFTGNTIFKSIYLRLRLAHFSIGPTLIGMLKAIIDTLSASTLCRALDARAAALAVSRTIT